MATKDDGKLTRKEFIGRASASLAVLGSLGWGGSPLFGWEAPQAKPPAGDPAGPAAGPGDPSARHSGKKAPALRLLGRTGLKVTPIGFGASRTMEPSLVKAALDRGINFFDTGRSYFNGRNEVMLGKALQGRRDEVVIQSKIPLRLRRKEGEPLSPEALKRVAKSLRASLDASLKALATGRVEVMLLHGISSPSVLENETVRDFFRESRKKGMIRACGFSTHANQAAMLRSANKDAFFDVVMVTYNHKGSFRHSRSGAFRALGPEGPAEGARHGGEEKDRGRRHEDVLRGSLLPRSGGRALFPGRRGMGPEARFHRRRRGCHGQRGGDRGGLQVPLVREPTLRTGRRFQGKEP